MSNQTFKQIDYIIVILLIFLITITIVQTFCNIAKASCFQHTVKKGESLKSIAKEYYGHKKYWLDIKYQNELNRRYLRPGQKLHLYIPEENEWFNACNTILLKRLADKEKSHKYQEASDIPFGVKLALSYLNNPNPIEKLEMCRWAIVTAEQESMYEFSVGLAGEVGMFQELLDTVRFTQQLYNIDSDDYDRSIVGELLDNRIATFYFILHFNYLYQKRGSLYLAWARYNGFGEHAKIYADRAIERYRQIKEIQPIKCKN